MKRDIRISVVGDSFVNGTGDPEKLGWVGRAVSYSENSEREITLYNLGVRRETSRDILLRWKNEVKSRFNDSSENYIIFSFGVNDTVIENGNHRVELQESLANLKTILQEATNYKTLFIGPPPIASREQNIFIERYNLEYKRVCRELNVPSISIFERLKDSEIWNREVRENDQAHPKSGGYKVFVDIVVSSDLWWFK